ncbi:MAG: periplasmic heavy metal sensor [Labilithrix sp.]|nr:periplasmic heavy metal sensor [Labilithrix sp.]
MTVGSIAIAVGVLAVFGVAKRLVLRRFFRPRACHPRWAGGRRGFGRSFWLRALFARLDTTPGQEREIRAALEDLRDRARDAKTDLTPSRESLGKAIAGESFDVGAYEAASARLDATSEKIKDAFRGALERIHGVLDPKQRARLAEILSKGGLGAWGSGLHGHGGPYRA